MQKRIHFKLPIANIFNNASRGLAVTAISGYQKFISPHKGFSCAHRVLYGCESCSQYFKRMIVEEGIFTAIANAKGRFQECREANEILKERRAKCRVKRNYYASRTISSTVAIESGDLEPSEDSDVPDHPEESDNSGTQKLGGSQWGRKQRSQSNNSNNGGSSNNCDDCGNCADGLNVIPNDCGDSRNCDNPLDGANCPDLNCDNANCLSGMDCSGLDCGSLDCGGCGDCGSCLNKGKVARSATFPLSVLY